MKNAIERLSRSSAIRMFSPGIGAQIVYAPPGEGGSGGEGGQNDDDKGGEGRQGGGDEGGDKGGHGGDNKGSGSDGGDKGGVGDSGLFKFRSNKGDEGGDGGDKGGGEGDDKGGADGRPAGVPEKFWDAEKKAIKTEDMAKAYSDLEKAHGKLKREKAVGGEVPEKAEDYFPDGLDLGDEVTNLKVEGPDDPGLKAWSNVCKERGIGKDLAADLAKDMFRAMNEFAPTPIDPEEERKSLGDNAQGVIDGVFGWLENEEKAGRLSEDDMRIAMALSHTANGMRFMAKMRSMSGQPAIPYTPGQGESGMSREEWHAEMRAAVQAKDYKRQEQLEAMNMFGDEAATSGPTGNVDPEKRVEKQKKS